MTNRKKKAWSGAERSDWSTIPWVHLDDITTPAVRSKKEKKAGKSGDGVTGEPA